MKIMSKILVLFSVLLVLSCSGKKVDGGESNQNDSITQEINLKLDDNVKGEYVVNPYNKSGYLIIKYSNLIYSVNNKRVIIPIFKGNKGSIEADKIRDYQINKGETATYLKVNEFKISDFIAPSKKGEMKKTFNEFLNFYQRNLLKDVDIEHPTDFGQDNSEWFITYDFEYSGIPCFMEIRIVGSEELTMRYKSVYEIQPDEHIDHFFYSIFLNGKSQYKK